MEQNQNTNGQLQPKEVISVEEHIPSEPVTPEIVTTASAEAKEETPTAVTQPQTDSMEVHKHPHHVMHKKKWSEYLLEFFMIFFAVFLGAEQPRAAEKLNTAFFSPAQELDDSGVIEALYKK